MLRCELLVSKCAGCGSILDCLPDLLGLRTCYQDSASGGSFVGFTGQVSIGSGMVSGCVAGGIVLRCSFAALADWNRCSCSRL